MTSAGSNAWRLLLGRWAINLLPSPHEKVPSLAQSVLGTSTMFLTRGDRCTGPWSGNWVKGQSGTTPWICIDNNNIKRHRVAFDERWFGIETPLGRTPSGRVA